MARLPSSVGFPMLRNYLKGLSSISIALFRRLLFVLLNFIRSSLSRKLPWFIPRLFQPAPGGRPKAAQSGKPPGIAVSNLPGITTAPANAPGKSTYRQSSKSHYRPHSKGYSWWQFSANYWAFLPSASN